MGTALPPLVASPGDPAGVGPELLLRAWEQRDAHGLSPFAVVADLDFMHEVARHLGMSDAVAAIGHLDEAPDLFASRFPVLPCEAPVAYRPGKPDAAGARATLTMLTQATRLAVAGEASALVTGPIAKAALQDIGFAYPGQTEFVAAACGVDASDAVMMLAGPSLRVVPMTVHVPLASVPSLLDTGLIVQRIAIAAGALTTDFGIANPRIAVCGLNPHAGEDGRLGDEDARIIAPAVRRLQDAGLDVVGPLPADGMFHKKARATYDLAIAMYHDQGLVPLKALDFDQGVNVTLGLPVVRTSPDHGTAFGLAGKGEASIGPTVAALLMAGRCAARRRAR